MGIKGAAKAGDAGKIAQRLFHRLADDDRGVLGRMVEVDMQVTLGRGPSGPSSNGGQAFQHVVQKTDPGVDIAFPRTVQVERHGNFRLAGLAFDGRGAHKNIFSSFRYHLPLCGEAH